MIIEKKNSLVVKEKDIFLHPIKIIVMKRLIAILLLAFGMNLNAQTDLYTAVDFTATDCNGNTINLFEILDRGQYVLIDFFYYNCGPCQKACPKLVEAYKALGCNEHDVFFMEISYTDSDAKCQEWDEKYGVEYPTIGVEGGGLEIADAYGIFSFPTVILISPRKSILIRDFPYFETGQDVVDRLTSSYAIDEYPCSEEPEEPENPEDPENPEEPEDPENPDACDELSNSNFKLYPNPASSYVRITSDINDEAEVKIVDVSGRCVKRVVIKDLSDATVSVDNLDKGLYFMMIDNKIEKLIIK